MNMKFKKGDKVKLKRECSGSIPGVIYTLKDKGTDGENIGGWLWAWDKNTGNHCGCSCEDNFILLTKMGKEKKEKTVKYLLKYDQYDEDPIEEFATLDEVKERVEELIEGDNGTILSSVKVYEVKSIAKVETQIVFK